MAVSRASDSSVKRIVENNAEESAATAPTPQEHTPEKDDGMQLENESMYRVLVSNDGEPLVNMVYAEVGGENYEVFGVFAGINAGGGMFHQNDDGITVSDDPGDFQSRFDIGEVEQIFTALEQRRAAFEEYNDEGALVGWSGEAHELLSLAEEDENGIIEAYSDGASEDFIYDCQDDWNLNYYKG